MGARAVEGRRRMMENCTVLNVCFRYYALSKTDLSNFNGYAGSDFFWSVPAAALSPL